MLTRNSYLGILAAGATVGLAVAGVRYLLTQSTDSKVSVLEEELLFDVESEEDAELEDTELEMDLRQYPDGVVRRVHPSSAPDSLLSAKVYFRTYGCSHNVSDSEFMMGVLVQQGHSIVESMEAADVCIFNSCTVKNPSQDAAVNVVAKAKQLGKRIVVTGCVPQADQSIPIFEEASLVGVSNIGSIAMVVEEAMKGHRIVAIGKSSDLPDITSMPKIRRNRLVEIIAVSTGCLGQCTYCKTKHARGELGSYSIEAILSRVKSAVSDGVTQIWLTSEDLGAYGIDIGTDIVKLLESIIEAIAGAPNVMLRLGMTNPPYMLQHAEAVGKILTHPQVFEFLHVPVQSGSNNVLRDMRREYTVEDFKELVERLRVFVPNITVATDIICGFPNESNEDHQETISLIDQYKFPVINISQFYPRPGTVAARMTRVPTKIAKQRSGEVTNLFESYSTTDRFLGEIVEVYFDDNEGGNARTGVQSVGHTKNYTKVIVPFMENIGGTRGRVKISSVHKWDIRGTLLE